MAPQVYQTDYVSQSWATSTLTNSVSGEDILGHVVNEHVAPYFVDTFHQYALSKLSGLLKNNASANGSDMIVTKGTDAVAADDPTTYASIQTFADGIQSMGDARAKIALAIMHSAVFTYLLKKDGANTVRASATTPFNTYMGIPVILDDSMPVTTGTNRSTYTVYLLGKGRLLSARRTLARRACACRKRRDRATASVSRCCTSVSSSFCIRLASLRARRSLPVSVRRPLRSTTLPARGAARLLARMPLSWRSR
jgi:hypothetical protein